MKYLIIILIGFGLVGCASVPRTKFTDKSMRITIDTEMVSEDDYYNLQHQLVSTGMFTVVDRGQGFRAIRKEQERTQREEPDRFSDKEKWSHWGKLYGVGAVVVPKVTCSMERAFLNPLNRFLRCDQFLTLVDSNTGEVVVAVRNESDGPSARSTPRPASWEETVVKFVEAYPKRFKNTELEKPLKDYQQESEKHAQEQKEIVRKLAAAKAEAEAKAAEEARKAEQE